jgi:hypothetical protein
MVIALMVNVIAKKDLRVIAVKSKNAQLMIGLVYHAMVMVHAKMANVFVTKDIPGKIVAY